jgi:hypothetical protein
MKKAKISEIADSYEAKKIVIKDGKTKEKFADFYSNALKFESMRRDSLARIDKKQIKAV